MESKPHHLCEWVQTFWKKKLMATVLGNNKLIRKTKVSALLRKGAKVFGKREWMTSNWCCIVCFCVGSSEIKRCFKNALSCLYLQILQGSCFTSSKLETRHQQILVFGFKDQCFMLELRNCFFYLHVRVTAYRKIFSSLNRRSNNENNIQALVSTNTRTILIT